MEAVQAGSRWINNMPSEDQVKVWFRTQHLHRGMEHEPYFGGIVIISATEKYKVSQEKASGGTFVQENERAVFTPYVKVDTRIAYFWNYLDLLNSSESGESEYVGVIEPVPQRVIDSAQSPYYNEHLPEGMFVYPVRNNANENVTRYIGARWRVGIYERQSWEKADGHAIPLLAGVGTKQTLMAKAYADDNAIMKAETGAIGRALGVAGILVVGTGVATAEDMQEAEAPGGAAATGSPDNATLPEVVRDTKEQPGQRMEGPLVEEGQEMGPAVEQPSSPQEEDERMRVRARELALELQQHPEAYASYRRWYAEDRKFPALDQLSGPALKGAMVKLERTLDEAKGGAQ